MPVIYQKTALAHQEITASQRSLNFRQRQVLILVDGKRTSTELAQALSQQNVEGTLTLLYQEGYIEKVPLRHMQNGHTTAISHTSGFSNEAGLQTPSSTSLAKTETQQPAAPSVVAAEVEHDLSIEVLNLIQTILLDAADQHLGLMGKPLKQKIMLVDTEKTLLVVLSQWHMAMRDSKSGRDVAESLLQKIQALFNAS